MTLPDLKRTEILRKNIFGDIEINTVQCDAQRMPIRIGSQTKFATVGRVHYILIKIPLPAEVNYDFILFNVILHK